MRGEGLAWLRSRHKDFVFSYYFSKTREEVSVTKQLLFFRGDGVLVVTPRHGKMACCKVNGGYALVLTSDGGNKFRVMTQTTFIFLF